MSVTVIPTPGDPGEYAHDLVRRAHWKMLNQDGPTVADRAYVDAFTARVNAMTDAEVESRLGFNSRRVIADLRRVLNTPWR